MHGIEIGYDKNNIYIKSTINKYDSDAILSENDENFFNTVKEIVNNDMRVVWRCDKYHTIVTPSDGDFIRFHLGKNKTWFSVGVLGEARKRFLNDDRFENVKNKNVIHWRIDIESIKDLYNYSDIIMQSYIDYSKI